MQPIRTIRTILVGDHPRTIPVEFGQITISLTIGQFTCTRIETMFYDKKVADNTDSVKLQDNMTKWPIQKANTKKTGCSPCKYVNAIHTIHVINVQVKRFPVDTDFKV